MENIFSIFIAPLHNIFIFSKKSTEDFFCNECSKIFHCKSRLKSHRCFITNNNSNIPTQETNKTPKPRKKDLTEKNSVLVQISGDTSEGAFRKNSDNEQQLE